MILDDFNKWSASQFNLMLIALTFFTRIPVRRGLDFSQDKLNRSSRYFSLVGWLVGAVCATSYYLANYFFSVDISIILSMLVGVFLTGSFHEDGLADTCDGFGGGWKKEDKLKIMKDSRLGTYGAVGLWFVLTLKYTALLHVESVVLALLLAHPFSRSLSSGLIYFLPYVVDDERSKIKPLAQKQQFSDWVICLLIGTVGLVIVPQLFVSVLICTLLLLLFLKYFFKKQIGGFTGDTLGATQQLSEIMIYLLISSQGVSG
jgi:adenosylcobinamide-GDP ribazoletransferase